MPRYFFHLRDRDQLIRDFDGSVLPDLDAARQEAREAVRTLLVENLKNDEVLDGQSFEITDEAGQVLEVVPFKSVLRLP